MVNAPTRPPNRDPGRRRPPEGPRLVPLSRRDQERVEKIQEASVHLRETGAPELAEHVDFLLTDEGANFVNRLRWKDASEENPNLAIFMETTLRDEIKAGVTAAGKTLPTQAVLALNAFLNGDYLPTRQENGPRGSGVSKSNLNVRVNGDLRQRVDEHGKKLLEDGVLDWAPRTSHVLKSWFVEKFTHTPGDDTQADLWTALRCAEFLGIDRDTWTSGVEDGRYPQSAGRLAGIDMWDVEEVRQLRTG